MKDPSESTANKSTSDSHPIRSKYGRWKNNNMYFPYLHDAIFLDIETNMEMTKVWLIGLKLDGNELQFLARSWAEEGIILNQLRDFLQEHPGKPLICYSTTNFDFRILMNAAKRSNQKGLINQLLDRAMIDMGTLLRRHYKPFGKSYSLKMLRYLIGYKYDNIALSGADVAIKYYRQVEKFGQISDEFAEQALKYNLDDIRILYEMIEKFRDHIVFTNDYSQSKSVSEIKDTLHEVLYSYKVNKNYIRISIDKNNYQRVVANLMAHGLPLPEVNEGVHTTALYWKSNFSYTCMKQLIFNLDLQ